MDFEEVSNFLMLGPFGFRLRWVREGRMVNDKYLAEDKNGNYLRGANQADENFRDKEYRPTESLKVIGVVVG